MKSGWENVDIAEVVGSALISLGVGMIRFLMLVRQGRTVKWVDAVLEPSLALFGGLMAWALSEVANAPDVMQAVMTSLGAWAGPRFIRKMEIRYLGGSRFADLNNDSAPVDLDDSEKRKKE